MIDTWIKAVWFIAFILSCTGLIIEGQKQKPSFKLYSVLISSEIFFIAGYFIKGFVK